MNIEINLLPEKPKKNYFHTALIGIICAVSMSLIFAGILYYHALQRDYERLQHMLVTTVKLQELAMEEQADAVFSPQLDSDVQRVEEDQVSAVLLLDQFIYQLTDQAYFVYYEYDESGAITITADFPSKRGVPSYLHHLNNLPFVTAAMIHNVESEESASENSESEERYTASFSIIMNMELVKTMQAADMAAQDNRKEGEQG
ncbi:type IV pilus assembly protein PilN [Evansella caseinilytica]|uniref:Type IV pilus assembly protein PilN n=1 Tax=Evansella caseinilytica TaxID=1503961 RepID=A0A1H3PT15_9BACI|nr:hypothetical protein [Evansella caseinilytica]SDZ04120.1 type IV pilus assembly protein PilN [Evansella caseinilytica]